MTCLFTLPASKITGASAPTLQLALALREMGNRVILLCQGGKLAREARKGGLEVDSLNPVALVRWGRLSDVVVVSRSRDHWWAGVLLGGARPLFRLWHKARAPGGGERLLVPFTRLFLSPFSFPQGPFPWRWLPGGVDTRVFKPGEKGRGAMEVVMVARMKPGRGQDELVKAVARVQAPLRLTFLGKGETLGYVRTLASELGVEGRFVAEKLKDYPAFLRRHHLLVYLSLGSEATARTVLEAMASGLVVVARPQGGVPCYLGGWNPPLRGDELVEVLFSFAWSPGWRKKAGILNAERARRFSRERRVTRFLKILERCRD